MAASRSGRVQEPFQAGDSFRRRAKAARYGSFSMPARAVDTGSPSLRTRRGAGGHAAGLLLDPGVALLLERQRQVLVPRAHDAAQEALVDVDQLHFLLDERQELDRVDLGQAAVLADGVQGGLQ